MSTQWKAAGADPSGGVEVTRSGAETWHDVRDGGGRLIGCLHHPARRAPWWLHTNDGDLDRDLASTDLPVRVLGARGFRSRKAAVEWLRQRGNGGAQ